MLSSIFQTCQPRAEILSGELGLDLFAAKLRLVVEGSAPVVYQSPELFFANTYPTEGIKNLIREVFGRLTGQIAGSPVIRLETSFGGGKTHDEIALWHICKQGRAIAGIERFADLNFLPTESIQVAAIDGRDLDPENGIYHGDTGVTTKTLWGEIAYQIGGVGGYQLLQASDQSGISPGTSVMERLMTKKPTVIILDEIARHLSAAKAKAIQDSNLAKQVVSFLFSLMDLAASCDYLVFVYSLASASDTFAEETNELQELISASARQERILTPSTDVEVYNIVKQRLFDRVDSNASEAAATDYLNAIRTSHANLPDAGKDAQYAQAIAQSYPFHPELFNLLTKKIASIPEFQKTRGALRLFAQVVRHLWQNQSQDWIPLIHTHHIPVGMDEDITSDLTTRLGRSPMRNPVGADIYNPTGREAYAQVQDQQWLLAGKPPFSTWVARTIFLHSLNQGTAAGIARAELNLSLLTPGLEISFVDQVLEQLVAVAWYLDDDPVTARSRFKEEPSINKIISEEKEQVSQREAKADLRDRRDSIFAKKLFTLIPGPDSAAEVDDRPDDIALCVIDFDDAKVNQSTDPPPPLLEQIFNNTGEAGKFRIFRNRLLFLVANRQELERAIDLAREYKAIQNILKSQTRLEDLSESQRKQIKERSGIKDLEVRVALTNAYRHLFYPDKDEVKAPTGLKHYTLPAEDSSTVKGKNNQQDVIFKALKEACDKIRKENPPQPYAPAYILQKVWPLGLDQLSTKALRETFAKDLSLKFLVDAEVSLLRDTIREGLKKGDWDMKAGERLFIKTEVGLPALPEVIEFSDRQVLYRRGILQPPVPKEIELTAEVMPKDSYGSNLVRVGWRAKEAVSVKLYQDGQLVDPGQAFRPRDEYENSITTTTSFKLVADYGNGEILEKEIQVSTGGKEVIDPITKPTTFTYEGTVDGCFNQFQDDCLDHKVAGIKSLEITIGSALNYRKLGTVLAQFNRPNLQVTIDQQVTIQSANQFLRFEYQGDLRGQQDFYRAIMTLLNNPMIEAQISLKLSLEFSEVVALESPAFKHIPNQLSNNPVDRLNLVVRVNY
jgi:hypothetical protein